MLFFVAFFILSTGLFTNERENMKLTSKAFENNKSIPKKYTCQGDDISPPLSISELPSGTKTLCLIVEDPDAPHGTFDHWIAWNITPSGSIEEGKRLGVEGTNGFGAQGYQGPCPPPGSVHHYHFKIYALDTELSLAKGSSKAQVIKAIQGHILAQAELVGTFQR